MEQPTAGSQTKAIDAMSVEELRSYAKHLQSIVIVALYDGKLNLTKPTVRAQAYRHGATSTDEFRKVLTTLLTQQTELHLRRPNIPLEGEPPPSFV